MACILRKVIPLSETNSRYPKQYHRVQNTGTGEGLFHVDDHSWAMSEVDRCGPLHNGGLPPDPTGRVSNVTPLSAF